MYLLKPFQVLTANQREFWYYGRAIYTLQGLPFLFQLSAQQPDIIHSSCFRYHRRVYIFTNKLDRHLHHCEVTLAPGRRSHTVIAFVVAGSCRWRRAAMQIWTSALVDALRASRQLRSRARSDVHAARGIFFFLVYSDILQVGTSELHLEASGVVD